MASNVLIIDDDQVMAKMMAKRLEKREFSVTITHSGQAGLDKLESIEFDLLLLDIKMPGMDGIEVLKTVRKNRPKNVLPIIMFSSCDGDFDVINCLKLGANDYVVKPVNMDVLLTRIATQLEVRNLSLQHARKEQLEAVGAMITTFNHEINNALAISMGRLERIKSAKYLPDDVFDKLMLTQVRIQEVVKKITKLSQDNRLEFSSYSTDSKMIDIS